MYDHRKIKYDQRIKDNFNFVFFVTKRDIAFAGDEEDFFCGTI